MYSEKFEKDQNTQHSSLEELREEVAVIEAQVVKLEEKYLHTSAPLKVLGKWLAIGTGEELAWVRFKLKLKEQDVSHLKAQNELKQAAVLLFGKTV